MASPQGRSNSARRLRRRARRRGRPEKPPDERRSRAIKVHLTELEFLLVRRRAGEARLSLSSYLRALALRRRPLPPAVPAVNLQMVEQLARVGNNLNRAVHLLHTGTLSPGFGTTLDRLLALVDAYRRQLVGLPEPRPS